MRRPDLLLPPERLRGRVDPAALPDFETTAELLDGPDPMSAGLAYQPRVRQALGLALSVSGNGFNVFAAGPTGLRKSEAILAVLQDEARRRPRPRDWIYVHDFEDPDRPRALSLPAGEARRFAKSMQGFVHELRHEIPKALEAEEYRRRRRELMEDLESRKEAEVAQLHQEAEAHGFAAELSPGGVLVAPVVEGEALSPQAFQQLPDETRERFEAEGKALRAEIEGRLRTLRRLEREGRERVEGLDRETVLGVARNALEDVRERHEGEADLLSWLGQVQDDVPDHVDDLKESDDEETPAMLVALQQRSDPFDRYRVNVFVDRSGEEGAPVVFEMHPTYVNLCGRMERRVELGNLVTDFTLLRPGALHRADGGFLVLFVRDLLQHVGAWDALKRSLKTSQVAIEDLPTMLGHSVAQVLKPEPIPLSVRLVLIGPPDIYQLLYVLDPDFRRLFQVRADFDDRIGLGGESLGAFARSVACLAKDEQVMPLDRTAVARLAEYAMRLAEDQEKLSTRFGLMTQVLREADRFARDAGREAISQDHVREAEAARRFRSDLPIARLRELVERGTLIVRTRGESTGQVNGLALSSMGDATIGRPVRITAAVSPGGGEVADIERRAELGGRIHTKAVMILSGYLASRYATHVPLAISAQLTFEQSYSEIEGDSASLAETLALLSAIGDLPLRQGLAVTGSVSHHGEVQPVGGVTDKIEGYYEICEATGLDGEQGVLVPGPNVPHLQLRDDVVDAVAQGRFRVIAVRTVDEALEVLTGLEAGERGADGRFPEGSANGRIQARLVELAGLHRRFLGPVYRNGGPKGHAARPQPAPPEPPSPEPEPPPGGPPPPPTGRPTD